jgi:teichuronic acid biosynthesis glycosyltransferase TuaC
MLNILTFSTLYPNAATPSHGVFVENRLRHLIADGDVRSQVVAPVPWFPFTNKRFGAYAQFARCPAIETRHEIDITHPRYPVIPKLSSRIQPWLLYAGARTAVNRALRDCPDTALIDAHYFYPDGVAAVMLAKRFKLPVTITARGTDLSLLADDPLIRPQIRWAAQHADGLITVCQALKDKLLELGIDDEKVQVLRNGVDLQMFRPVNIGDKAGHNVGAKTSQLRLI